MVRRKKSSNANGTRRQRYKVTNWREYNESLKQRGSLTIWMSEDIKDHWYAKPQGEREAMRGRICIYSDQAIKLILTLRSLYKLPLRQVTGFCESILKLGGFALSVPHFSRLSRRGNVALNEKLVKVTDNAKYLIIDSTGIKLFGEREWLENKYKLKYQRKIWRKMSICIDDKGFIISRFMSNHLTHDQDAVEELLNQTNFNTTRELTVIADRGYGSKRIYNFLETKGIKPIIPPPKNSIEKEDASEFRNQTVKYIRDKGFYAWACKNDYGRREKVENSFYRYKAIIGSKLRSRKWDNQDAETHLGCHILIK